MICMCSTMFRTDPQHLCAALRSIRDGHITNRIEVPHQQKRWAKLSLERMLNLG